MKFYLANTGRLREFPLSNARFLKIYYLSYETYDESLEADYEISEAGNLQEQAGRIKHCALMRSLLLEQTEN
jgi:hypothetical protein